MVNVSCRLECLAQRAVASPLRRVQRAPLTPCAGLLFVGTLLWSACFRPVMADPPPPPPSASDAQDFVLLLDQRPVFVRLHVNMDGKPFRQIWREYLERLFDERDRDHDGVLDKSEAAGVPDLTAGSLAVRVAVQRANPLERAANAEGKITREAFLAYHEKSEAAPFTTRQGQGRSQAATALFDLLDADHDHQLSAEELRGAELSLRKRDFDDDEIITDQELLPGQNPYGSGIVVVQAGGQPGQARSGMVFLIEPGTQPGNLATALLQRYDSNKDGAIAGTRATSPEVVLDPEVFAQLDTNGNGSLDADELGRFADRSPDVELRFAMGTETVEDAEQEAQSNDRQPSPGYSLKRLVSGTYEIHTGDARLRIEKNNANPGAPGRPVNQVQFRQFDTDNKGYIDEDEAKRNPFISNLFKVMDRNGDGMLRKEEFDAYFERLNEAAATRLTLEVTDNGQELFQMLDADSDGRLTLRELRAAPQLLTGRDADRDGRLSGSEIPRNISMVLSRSVSSPNLGGRVVFAGAAGMRAQPPRAATPAGPLWFRKMDRNHDGDLSPREFLGSREDFDRLDANHDGLIDAKEAEQAGKLPDQPMP